MGLIEFEYATVKLLPAAKADPAKELSIACTLQ
jgi:hypothetical protein